MIRQSFTHSHSLWLPFPILRFLPHAILFVAFCIPDVQESLPQLSVVRLQSLEFALVVHLDFSYLMRDLG